MRMGGIKKCILVLLCLILALPALSFAAINEDEPNNSMFAAKRIKNATNYNGTAPTSGDQDWFVINATQDDALVHLEFTNQTKGSWRVEIRDADTRVIDGLDTNGTIEESYERSKGIYYIIVKPDDFENGQSYTLKVTGDVEQLDSLPTDLSDSKLETEPNDKWDQADNLVAETKYAGHMKTSDDQDWFKFYVNKKDSRIKLQNFKSRGEEDTVNDNATNASGSPSTGWTIKVYNDRIEDPDTDKVNCLVGGGGAWNQNTATEDREFKARDSGIYYLMVNIDGKNYRNLVLNGTGLSGDDLPTAYAGKDDTISEDRDKYTLDASDSSGGDNYEWEEIQPWNNNSSITLSNKNSKETSFDVPPVDPPHEAFTFELTVRNSTSDRYDKDRVTITIEDTYDGGGSSEGGCSFAPDANLGWGWVSLLIVVAALPFIRKRIVN